MGEWQNRYAKFEKIVGGGFYAMRTQFSKSGKVYDKLVKADRSPAPTFKMAKGVPSVGNNPRRQRILDRRTNKAHLIKE